MSLLGSMLLDPAMIGSVLSMLPSHSVFYREAHAEIYRAVVDVYDRHNSGDLVQINELLRERDVLDDVGGVDYLVELAESVPSAVNAPHYARIVAEKYKLRRLIDAAGQILYDSYHAGNLGPDEASEIIDAAEQAVFDIAMDEQKADPQKLGELLQQQIDLLEARMDGRAVEGITTGFTELDSILSGLHPGELVIVAARPSMGKTALALNMAEQIAAGGRVPTGGGSSGKGGHVGVGVFSLEMSRPALTQRLMSSYSGVNSHNMRTGKLTDDDFRSLFNACSALAELPMYIDDAPGLTLLQLRARARRMVAQHGIGCIIIDYLQLLTSPSAARESRQVEVSTISRGIKALARELNVPVICLAQLNRAVELRTGNRPRMSDLRESGSIEQDADVVMLLHREEYYHIDDESWAEDNPDKAGVAELIVAKQRNGPTGVVELTWDSKTTRFKNHTSVHDDFTSYPVRDTPRREPEMPESGPSADDDAPF